MPTYYNTQKWFQRLQNRDENYYEIQNIFLDYKKRNLFRDSFYAGDGT